MILDVVSKGKYVKFLNAGYSDSGKTHIWEVSTTNNTHDSLGRIRYHGPWRCYAFYPFKETLYEKRCLRDIAQFLEEQTQALRNSWIKKSEVS